MAKAKTIAADKTAHNKITNRMLFAPVENVPVAGMTGFGALNALKATPLPGDLSFPIKQLVKAARAAADVYDEERKELLNKFGLKKMVKGPDGDKEELVTAADGQVTWDGTTDEERQKSEDGFAAAMKVLFDQPTEIELRTFDYTKFGSAPIAGVIFDALDWLIVDGSKG